MRERHIILLSSKIMTIVIRPTNWKRRAT